MHRLRFRCPLGCVPTVFKSFITFDHHLISAHGGVLVTQFDWHSFILDESVSMRSLQDYAPRKKGNQIRLVPKPLHEINLVPGVNMRSFEKIVKASEEQSAVSTNLPSQIAGEKKEITGEEKEKVEGEEKEKTSEEKEKKVEGEEKKTSEEIEKTVDEEKEITGSEEKDTEKPQEEESAQKKEDESTRTPEMKKEETATPTTTQSTSTNSQTDNDLLTDHPDMYFAD